MADLIIILLGEATHQHLFFGWWTHGPDIVAMPTLLKLALFVDTNIQWQGMLEIPWWHGASSDHNHI